MQCHALGKFLKNNLSQVNRNPFGGSMKKKILNKSAKRFQPNFFFKKGPLRKGEVERFMTTMYVS